MNQSAAKPLPAKTISIDVDVVSDVMCPWCYIGKRNLEEAAKLLDGIDLKISWRPYQLDPTLPPEGKDRRKYLEDKFGGPERAKQIYARVTEAGKTAGIGFNFEAIPVSANTLDAHRLIRWAGGRGAEFQNRIVTRLFQLYFEEGQNIGDHIVLAKAAADCGMDANLVRDLLKSDADRAAVNSEIEQAQKMGITGVPCFIIGMRQALMGAQPPQALADAIRNVASGIAATAASGTA